MRNTTYLFLVVLFFFASCAKEQLEVEVPQQTPLFKVNLMKNGQPLLIEAGKDNFYLYTDASVSADGDIFAPISEFSKLDPCTSNCLETFSINIKNIPTAEVNSYFDETDFNPEKFNLLANPDSAGAVIIKYVNQDGIEYLSSLGAQTNENHFTITEIETYLNNDKGQQTKLVHAILQCNLYNNSGTSIELKSEEIIVAIAIP